MPCWGASRSRRVSSRRIGRWLTRAPATVPAPAAVASAAPSSAATSPILCPATPRLKREAGQQAAPQNKDAHPRLPTLAGPSRAGRPHLELELLPLFCACNARDAGEEGRVRLAEGIAGNVVARLVVDDMRRAYHLVLPDHRLLSAPTVRRPVHRWVTNAVQTVGGMDRLRAAAAHIAAPLSSNRLGAGEGKETSSPAGARVMFLFAEWHANVCVCVCVYGSGRRGGGGACASRVCLSAVISAGVSWVIW